jgi:choline dehydrogenase
MARELTADLVIVGAGAAGAVIASRVTERTKREVLLVEAGPDYPDGVVPRDLDDGTRNSMIRHDWGYWHRPTASRLVRHKFPRGKVVGGSSAVNTCIALRGRPYDYDEWGLSEWTWEKCLPAFKRLETDLDFDGPLHGKDGPIPIRRHSRSELARWQSAFLDGCKEIGLPECPDHNDPTMTGAGPHAMNKVDGHRMSAARCYLGASVRARPNLTILSRTMVHRVILGRTIAIECDTHGVFRTIRAREIILCTGALATVGILLRSGIGPKAELDRLGVGTVRDVPAVGRALLDHPGAAIFFKPKPGVMNTTDPVLQTLLRFSAEKGEFPDDMQVQPGSAVVFPRTTFPLVSLMCSVGKPHGRGTIRFPNARPDAVPRIESDVLGHPVDRARIVDALLLARRISKSGAMKDLAEPFFPRTATYLRRDDLDRAIEWISGSGYHPCGTVPMGDAVDAYGRFDGIENLRICDASLMPTIPSANTHLSVLMMGERFAEWVG